MAARIVGEEAWKGYFGQYKSLSDKLSDKTWFAESWQTNYDYLNKSNPNGVWFQLVKKDWCDGAIHIETWVNNPVIERKKVPLVLHIETSKEKHGLSRNDFSKLFLERCGNLIQSWPGYTLKPNYAMEPLNTQLPFTQETLASVLEKELGRLQQLGDAIDQTIRDVRK